MKGGLGLKLSYLSCRSKTVTADFLAVEEKQQPQISSEKLELAQSRPTLKFHIFAPKQIVRAS